ncbi:MAG: Rieske (2Fe-2S) protein [Anaerolineae bacterium]
MTVITRSYVRAGTLEELRRKGCLVVSGEGQTIALFMDGDKVYAVDNRCPHMGFPLSKGSVHNGILTCHWHHARFDLASGGTFDPFADDVRVFPVHVEDGVLWVDPHGAPKDWAAYWRGRLADGLEQDLNLIIVKSILSLLDQGVAPGEVLAIGADFGTLYRSDGWGPGLTIMTAMANILPALGDEDRVLALYHGLSHVSSNTVGRAPRFDLDPLPPGPDGATVPLERLKEWLRGFIEVRDADGAERCLRTALAHGATSADACDMLMAAATDHAYIDIGHPVDFINKAFELLELTGWSKADAVLPSLIVGIARARRSEESNAWRHPIDLIKLVDKALAEAPQEAGPGRWQGFDDLVDVLLDDEPNATLTALNQALADGASPVDLSQVVAYAAALRVARFHTANEFGDWDTVLHTFTYANAIDQAMRRAPSRDLLRGVYHGAMSVYLDRFLNTPPARLPDERSVRDLPTDADALLTELLSLMDRQQQVNQAGAIVYRYLSLGYPPARLLATLGHALLREDTLFHTYQMLEAGYRQYGILAQSRPALAPNVLVGVARYVAAHCPTARAMLQTANIAMRLHRGDDLTVEAG